MDNHSHPEIIQMQVQLAAVMQKVDHHDKLLVTGTDEQLSLPEIVRALTATVNSYIRRKEQEEVEKKQEWGRWRWAILGTAIPASILFLVQAAIFFFRFIPIMYALAGE